MVRRRHGSIFLSTLVALAWTLVHQAMAGSGVAPFSLQDVGVVIDYNSFAQTPNVLAGASDPSAVELPDGRIRLYFDRGDSVYGHAISNDGITFEVESGDISLGIGMATVISLGDGTYRMFGRSTDMTRILSAISDDGIEFALEAGSRVEASDFGVPKISGPSIVSLATGGYRMYLSSDCPPGEGCSTSVYSATSTDMLTWSTDPGVRLGPGAEVLVNEAVHPAAKAKPSGAVVLFYPGNCSDPAPPTGGGPPPSPSKATELCLATSDNGLDFDAAYLALESPYACPTPCDNPNPPGDPDVLNLPDGRWLVYYGQHTNSEGDSIRVARAVPAPQKRTVSLRINDRSVATGSIRAVDGWDQLCARKARVRIQKKTPSGWVVVTKTLTGSTGRYQIKVTRPDGTYRAMAPAAQLPSGQGCMKTFSSSVVK